MAIGYLNPIDYGKAIFDDTYIVFGNPTLPLARSCWIIEGQLYFYYLYGMKIQFAASNNNPTIR